jgi:hypothetical protein
MGNLTVGELIKILSECDQGNEVYFHGDRLERVLDYGENMVYFVKSSYLDYGPDYRDNDPNPNFEKVGMGVILS